MIATGPASASKAVAPPTPPSSRQQLDAAIGDICATWWAELADVDLKTGQAGAHPKRAALAELRRITTIEGPDHELIDVSAAIGVHGYPAYLDLHRRLRGRLGKWQSAQHVVRFAERPEFAEHVAVVAATLARVRELDARPVAKLLGAKKSRDDAPLLAEARFKRLIRATIAPDLLDQGRRIVMLLGRTANVGDLGASLLLWHADANAKRRWSFAYYDAEDANPDDAGSGAAPADAATTSPA